MIAARFCPPRLWNQGKAAGLAWNGIRDSARPVFGIKAKR